MKIVYSGKQSNQLVIVDRATGREFRTDSDGVADVPDALGKKLLEQSIWAKAVQPKPIKEKD
jgi:hypothetical protein